MSAITTQTRSAARRLPLLVLGTLLTFSLVSCGYIGSDKASWPDDTSGAVMSQEPSYSRDSLESGIAPPIDGGAGPDASTIPPDDRLVIRILGMRVQVEEVEPAVEALREAVESAGGMVTAVQVSTDDTPVYRYDEIGALGDGTPLKGYLTARIPPAKVDGYVEAVSDLGELLRQAEDESDVTQEHVDMSARLENLRAQEERLRELFERAEEIEDLLAVERELARVRGDIESYEARIAHLERQAAMATVTVELVGRQPVVAPPGDDWGFVAAVRTGIRGLVGTINGLIIVTLSMMPLLVLALVVALLVRAFVRKRRNHRVTGTTANEDEATTSPDDASGQGA